VALGAAAEKGAWYHKEHGDNETSVDEEAGHLGDMSAAA